MTLRIPLSGDTFNLKIRMSFLFARRGQRAGPEGTILSKIEKDEKGIFISFF